jgi:hypothetical protein
VNKLIEVKIPKEIKDYKEKLFLNFTLRQVICITITLLINIPLYLLGKQYIKEEILSWIIILIAVPTMTSGFFKYNDMTLEQFVIAIVKFNILPQKKIYKVENLFEILIENDNKNGGKLNVQKK